MKRDSPTRGPSFDRYFIGQHNKLSSFGGYSVRCKTLYQDFHMSEGGLGAVVKHAITNSE